MRPLHIPDLLRRVAEYAVGAALVLGHLAMAGRRLALVEPLPATQATPDGDGATPEGAAPAPISRASG